MEIIKENDVEAVELVRGEYFRVHSVARVSKISETGDLYVEELPLSYGLNVEKKYQDEKGEYFVVVLSIRWDSDKNKAIIEDSTDDCLDVIETLIDQSKDGDELMAKLMEFRNAKDFALKAVNDIHGVE